jgi:hypothetical protein
MAQHILLTRIEPPMGGNQKKYSVVDIRDSGSEVTDEEKRIFGVFNVNLSTQVADQIYESIHGPDTTEPNPTDYLVEVNAPVAGLGAGDRTIDLINVPGGLSVKEGDEVFIPDSADKPYLVTTPSSSAGGQIVLKINTGLDEAIESETPVTIRKTVDYWNDMKIFLRGKEAFEPFNYLVEINTDNGFTAEQIVSYKDQRELVDPITIVDTQITKWRQ